MDDYLAWFWMIISITQFSDFWVMSYGNWKHILDIFSFHNSIFNGISVIKTTYWVPRSESATTFDPLFFFFFFFSLGSVSLVSSSSFFSFSFHTRWLLLLLILFSLSRSVWSGLLHFFFLLLSLGSVSLGFWFFFFF